MVPLTGVRTDITIVDFTASVTIRQRFENVEKDPIEAVYEFPVDPKVACHIPCGSNLLSPTGVLSLTMA